MTEKEEGGITHTHTGSQNKESKLDSFIAQNTQIESHTRDTAIKTAAQGILQESREKAYRT